MTTKTQSLADALRAIRSERSSLTLRDTKLKAEQERIEAEILAAIPEDLEAMILTLDDGASCTVKRKSTTRYSTAAGEADAFFDWVSEHNAIHFMNRTVKQDAVKGYQAQFNQLPPGITTVVEHGISFTVKKAKQELDI
jgi:hypothetical protein